MPDYQLPSLHQLTPEQVQEVIYDIKLQQKGTEIELIIDPHEIFDFCFPIDPSSQTSIDVNKIADDQIALHEVFFIREKKPIIPFEYIQEIESIRRYFVSSVSSAYNDKEVIERLIEEGHLKNIKSSDREELEKNIQDKLNILLAVSLRIYSLGNTRFIEIIKNRVTKDLPHEKSSVVQNIYRNYKQSPIFKLIIDKLTKKINADSSNKIERNKRMRNAIFDASIIDRLIYLNWHLNKAFDEKKIKKRKLFLYLSSAQRTQTIFNLREVKEALPKIGQQRLSFWRTRPQYFSYVVHKGSTDEETINNLNRVKTVLEEIRQSQKFQQLCNNCVLKPNGHETDGNCQMAVFCKGISDVYVSIQNRRKQAKNLSLVKNIISYEDIYTTTSIQDGHFNEYINLIQSISKKKSDWAIEKSLEIQKLNEVRSNFAGLLPHATQLKGYRNNLRHNRDVVTGLLQYLPLYPDIKSKKYMEIWKLIYTFYVKHSSVDRSKESLIILAYEKFLKIEVRVPAFLQEHELVRCLLYLTFEEPDETERRGDERAFQLAQEIINKHPECHSEFYYVALWAGRRAKKYNSTEKIGLQAIQQFPKDPRYYHGRSLNICSWLSDEEKDINCTISFDDAINDTKTAIKLYFQEQDIKKKMIGCCYNNLAYIYSYDKTNPCYDLNAAYDAINELTTYIPEKTWSSSGYFEFFHTSAHFKFEAYLNDNDNDNVNDLRVALNDIKKAVYIYPKPLYLDLQKKIEAELSILKNQKYKPL